MPRYSTFPFLFACAMCSYIFFSQQQLTVASRSLQIKVYEWPSATCVRSFKAHDGPVVAMDYELTSTLLATGRYLDNSKRILDRDGKRRRKNRNFFSEHFYNVFEFSGSSDASIRIWDMQGYFCTHSFRGFQGVVRWTSQLACSLSVISPSFLWCFIFYFVVDLLFFFSFPTPLFLQYCTISTGEKSISHLWCFRWRKNSCLEFGGQQVCRKQIYISL